MLRGPFAVAELLVTVVYVVSKDVVTVQNFKIVASRKLVLIAC